MTEPLQLSFRVACAPEHAFDMWTARTSMWWPADHTASGEDGVEVVIEPRVGGRIFERTAAGREEDWGEVLVWEPPRRLAYLWHLRADRGDAWRERNSRGWETLLPWYVDICEGGTDGRRHA